MTSMSQENGNLKERVREAVDRWQQVEAEKNNHLVPLPALKSRVNGNIFVSMPRRTQVKVDPRKQVSLPQIKTVGQQKASFFQTIKRFGVWMSAFYYFAWGTLWDIIRRRDTPLRRAIRLRESFERAGGTIIKICQQLSIRLDILPQMYCNELAKMLDKVPPFPTEDAVRVIERSTGKPIKDIFSVFDPEPIGSASIACVYQAVLRETGEHVAVKVRRPGIEQVFAADFRAMDWMMGIAENLTLLRPGFSANFRQEFRKTLVAELDFRREGRFQDIFRRRASVAEQKFFSAPRVLYEYSNDEMLVQEFVSGMWLWEVLAAIEQQDPDGLAQMEALDIDPKVVAQRLLYVNYWGLYENIAFHADPHPANIVVRQGGELVFIDFGASGHFNQSRRTIYQRFYDSQANEDVWGMVQAILVVAEPLPPMDINAFAKDVESHLYEHMLVMKSDHAEWYERTTATMWIAFLNLINKYKMVAPMDILLIARATLLYDSLAARLDPKINYFDEFQRYFRDAHRQSRKRVQQGLEDRLRYGLTDADYEVIEKLVDTGNRALYRLQRMLSVPYDFMTLPFAIEKWVFAVFKMFQLGVNSLVLFFLMFAGHLIYHYAAGMPLSVNHSFQFVITSRVYQLGVIVLAIIALRRITFRWSDKTRLS